MQGALDERRQSPRYRFQAPVTLQNREGEETRWVGVDISDGGIKLEGGTGLRVGARFLVSCNLSLDGQLHPFRAIGQVCHSVCAAGARRFYIGMRFVQVPPKSLAHLQRYIQSKSRSQPEA